MRAIELLVNTYPDKTGKEILEIQKQEELEEQKAFEKYNKRKLAYIKDLNENGAYFRGKFGLDQHFYYRVFDLVMDEKGNVHMSIEKIVLFINLDGNEHTVCKAGHIHFERNIEDYQNLNTYSLEHEERITIKEWNKLNDYLNNLPELFWNNIIKS